MRVLLDMFYGLSALRQVPPLAASEGAQAAAPVELSKEQLGLPVTVRWENVCVGGVQGVLLFLPRRDGEIGPPGQR